jgi:aspartate racemase
MKVNPDPAMRGVSARISALSPEKRTLLELGLLPKTTEGRTIARREGDAPCPLSFPQQRFWFLSRMEPENPSYNIPFAVGLKGKLDEQTLERSLTELLGRHEMLRTVFPDRDGVPYQHVLPPEAVRLRKFDLFALTKDRAEAQSRFLELANDETQRPFDLAKGPLVTMMLVKFSEVEHVLLVLTHHINFDGWSKEIFIEELESLYGGYRKGDERPLAKPPIQYADFTLWQRERLRGEFLEEHITYWKQRLGDNLPVLELPTDRPRPPVQSYNGGVFRMTLTRELSASLKELSLKQGATLFMTLSAAFNLLLHRYTGDEDIVIGTEIAGRTDIETEKLLGFFVNILVLRTDLSGDPTFRELLGRVRLIALEAYEHQELSFDKLVEELNPERDLSRTPLFQVSIQLKNTPKRSPMREEISMDEYRLDKGFVMFDLVLDIMDEEEGLVCQFEYNTDLFDASTIERMAGHFRMVLEGAVEDPDKRLSELALLAREERRRVLYEWNDTKTDYPKDKCVHELFEARVESAPDAVAVTCGEESLTYGELNGKANRLAHNLETLGVRSGSMVALCAERSLDAVVGIVGILKAGGAYVPLDPTYPKERLAYMLEDTGAKVLLAQDKLKSVFSEYKGEVVSLDGKVEAPGLNTEGNPENTARPEDPAYVIYTSGSTGEPKGVSVKHRAVVRLVVNTDYVKLKPSDVIAQASTLSFDAATFELWGALLNGARLEIIPRDIVLSPRDFAEEIRDKGINTIFLTTALFNQFAAEVPWAFASVRHLLFGGEAVDPNRVRAVLQNGAPRRLLHVYGPTENTTFTTWHLIESVAEKVCTVPIGRPIANTSVYVLDSGMNPVPIGVSGELYIGGDGLARGYLNSHELTAEKFVHDPFSSDPGARLYRTGDIVRCHPDGNIEFLGRFDNQVKLRGFRIELGEIESTLTRHPAVKEAVVILREDTPGEGRLAAYIVLQEVWGTSADKLRSFLKEKLPGFMVPPAFVMLDSLPLTPNGKVDREALSKPDAELTEGEEDFAAPRDEVERKLAAIWESLLGVKPIGVRDDFFELGGHSLMAARLFSLIEREFGNNLPLARLFDAATIEGLANVIREKESEGSWPSLVPIKTTGSRPPLFCVHGLAGNVLRIKELANYIGAEQPLYALQSRGLDGKAAPYERVEDMAAHYIREVRTLQPEGPYLIGGLCFGGVVALEMARQLTVHGQEVALLAILETYAKPLETYGLSMPDLRAPRTPLNKLFYQWQNGQLIAFLRVILAHKYRALYLWLNAFTPLGRRLKKVRLSNLKARKNYKLLPYSGRITIFKTAVHDLNPIWNELAAEGLDVHVVPGAHSTFLKEPNVKSLAEKLRASIDIALIKETNVRTRS